MSQRRENNPPTPPLKMSELTQAEKLRPLFTPKIRGRQRLCQVGECRKSFNHDTADGSLAYHIVAVHREVAEQLSITHFRKRQRSDASVASASSSSPPPSVVLPASPGIVGSGDIRWNWPTASTPALPVTEPVVLLRLIRFQHLHHNHPRRR